MLVFREGRQRVCGPALFRDLICRLRSPGANNTLNLSLRLGVLECALEDARSPAASALAHVADAVADALIKNKPPVQGLANYISRAQIPETLTISRPEGFAFYALHPLNYVDLADTLPLEAPAVAVLGIRSIGTTLGAVVAGALRRRGVRVERLSVRPEGHPWNRVLRSEERDRQWVMRQIARGAEFWVVDEGPGLSGSSFLAVGEALIKAGVPIERITFLCCSEPDVSKLCAVDATTRWRRFRSVFVRAPWRIPGDAALYFSGGRWRACTGDELNWPASWLQFERLKYLSRDRKSLLKFEGLGTYGEDVLKRAQALCRSGFSQPAEAAGEGFVRYRWLTGTGMRAQHSSRAVLDRIAQYCAWRATQFATQECTDLSLMVRTNVQEEFGGNLAVAELACERVVVVDGRMHPHKWLPTEHTIVKIDAVDHGDDHFFPGPTDIAWDLAGAIVEWQLDRGSAKYLLDSYARASGDEVRRRLPGFLLAYAIFQLGYCRMAAAVGGDERSRFTRQAERYRAVALPLLEQPVAV